MSLYVFHIWKNNESLEVDGIYDAAFHTSPLMLTNLSNLVIASRCSRNCSPGTYPLYGGSKCCGICKQCNHGYVKPSFGQYLCSKCPEGTLVNQNQTDCLPLLYKHYVIPDTHKKIVWGMSVFGIWYISIFFGVFVYYKNTPMVKSSNFHLSVIQLLLHLTLNCQFLVTVFDQTYLLCVVQSVAGGYVLKLIMLIYTVKTNQLLIIFRSNAKLNRSRFIKLKELSFQSIFLAINVFMSIILLTEMKSVHGILEIEVKLIRYKFCDTTFYVNIDILLVTTLSFICSIQSFLARRLPANFNETYYIFLGMFASVLLLVISFPLDVTFNKDGRKIFVNSCLIYFINIMLVSITYGYKIFIILFQKHKNTNEVFQKILLKCMQEHVRKRTEK